MITNQNNNDGNRMRMYGNNERASSTSSGPKWTSSITDLLVNRSNTMRFNNQPTSQSHHTSQHQLLAHQQQQQPTSMQHIHSGQPQSSEGGRLMMKLMNLGSGQQQMMHHPNHQPTASSVSAQGNGATSNFDHPRLSGSRDDQKRLALDECTNYLQQKTMQQHFPSTSMAISNIINSNRSASSAGIPMQTNGTSQSTCNAAKKFQAFKFNLTMNKNKALNTQKGVEPPPHYSSNAFYQPQSIDNLASTTNIMNVSEDNDAIVISEKQRKQMQALSRGSSQLAMKQHLKQMIKSYEDQPQVLTNINIGADGKQRFDHHETQQVHNDQQLTYDNTIRQVQNPQPSSAKVYGATGSSAASSSKGKPLEKKVHEMEERQKIFEEEIIKRVKEIQNYAKTLHMHLKKIQQHSSKKSEDIQFMKDQIDQLRDSMDNRESTPVITPQFSEQQVHDVVGKRLQILDSELSLQIEHLEQKLVKDYDGKIARQARATQNEFQSKSDLIKDDILSLITQEFSQNLKNEVMRQVSEKIKEAIKVQDKSVHELSAHLYERVQSIEDIVIEQNRETNQKQEKLIKTIKDSHTHSDETTQALGDALRDEMEQMRKRVMKDLKSEFDMKSSYVSHSDLSHELEQFENKLSIIQNQLVIQTQQQTNNKLDEEFTQRIEELQQILEDQIGQVANELASTSESQKSMHEHVNSIQEACLKLKSHQTSSLMATDEKIDTLDTRCTQLEQQLENSVFDIKDQIAEVRQAIQTSDDKGDSDMVVNQVMEQVQPELENFNGIIFQLQQQIEQFKLQLSQKLLRTELQEVKQDIDDEIKSLEKLIKKSEEHINLVESSQGSQILQLSSEQEDSQNQISDIKKNLSAFQVKIESRVSQLSNDLQSKTEDLYQEIKDVQDLQQKQQQVPTVQTRSESTPERKSRLEAMASLKVSLEAQISEINDRLSDLDSQFQQLPPQGIEESLLDEKLQSLHSVLITKIQTLSQPVPTSSPSLQTQFDAMKSQMDEQLDDTFSKVNEIDARMSQLEEKQMEIDQNINKESDIEQIEKIQAQIEEIRTQLNDQDEKVSSILNEQNNVYAAKFDEILTQFAASETRSKQQNKEISQEIKNLRELNNCVQDVIFTKDDFNAYKTQIEKHLNDSLQSLRTDNLKLSLQIETLRQSLELQSRNTESNSQKIIVEINKSEENLENHEERIKKLEENNHQINERLVARSIEVQQVNILANSYRTQQNNMNFLSSPRPIENQSPDPKRRDAPLTNNMNYQGHFLENLSEAISSPNNFGNQTGNEADMMIFNNQSQSIGRNSILSNRLGNLVSPIGDRYQLNSQFNSQVTGSHRLQQPSSEFDQVQSPSPSHNNQHSQNHSQEIDIAEQEEHKSMPKSTTSDLQVDAADDSEQNYDNTEEEEDQDQIIPNQEDVYDTESPLKEDEHRFEVKNGKDQEKEDDEQQQDEDNYDNALQEINISLESPREDQQKTPLRQLQRSSSPRTVNHHLTSAAPHSSQERHSQSKINSPILHTSMSASENRDVDLERDEGYGEEEEERKSDSQSSNRNVEEALQDLIDAEVIQVDEQEEEEKVMNELPSQNLKTIGQRNQAFEGLVQESDEEEVQSVQLLSPTSQIHPASILVHHGQLNQQQANHFVAFESDEEDAQQYDLVPISHSRNSSNPSASIPPNIQQQNNRNRYYESGSGEDESDPLSNTDNLNRQQEQQSDLESQEQNEIDDFNVQFQERDVQRRGLQNQDRVQQQEEENKEAEFDDSPFDAASSQRFDQRFEDEGDIRRPITSLARQLQQERDNEDPDFQAIQHETLSSHRSSELSYRNGIMVDSRRSGSPNLDHNNDNFDANEDLDQNEEGKSQDDDIYSQEINPASQGDDDNDQQSSSHVLNVQTSNLGEDFSAEESYIDPVPHTEESYNEAASLEPLSHRVVQISKVEDYEQPEETFEEENNADDWNLEDVTASQRLDKLEYYDEDDEDLQEELKQEDGGPNPSELKSELVANIIMEEELTKCIQAALNIKNLWKNTASSANPNKKQLNIFDQFW